MTIQITQTTPQPPLQVTADDIVTFRGWYTNSFVAADGVTPVEGGNGQTGFYYEEICSLNDDGFPVIPALNVQPTTGSNPTAGFFGALFVNGAFAQMIFGYPQATAGWQIPTSPLTTTFGALALYNAAVQLLYPPNTYPTFNQVVQLIQLLAGNFQYAAVGLSGITQLSYPPESASVPIALGQNDPTVGDLLGTLTEGVVPRADGEKTLIDGLITDNGIDVSVQTLNKFQAGDFQVLQNGSLISVDDTFGRANLFAGGTGGNEYAGVSCACDSGKGKVFVQSTGYTNLYGSEGVTALGDGRDENNGTKIVIDDPNELVKIFNLPTSDPSVLNALWISDGTLKVSAG